MSYRLVNESEIETAMAIIEDGRAFLKPQGGGQWQNGYPSRDTILEDIRSHRLFGVLDEEGKLAGVCALTYHEDDYDHLYEGHWLSDLPYMVMHRIAVKSEYRGQGYGKALFEVFEMEARKQGYASLRIDTHENNAAMRHLLEKSGFLYCGKAILTPNKDRMVFEKLLK